MFANQRQQRILDEVAAHGGARVSALVELLGVSDMTVRRDVETLSTRGLVERVHGGVMSVTRRSTDEPGFHAKWTLQNAEKVAIARAAATLVEPGSAVALSAGTTTYEVARALCAVPDLTVVTNSVPVAQLLHDAGGLGQTVVLTGGVRTPSDALVGPVTMAALLTLHVDWLFLGVHGMGERSGLTTPNLVEAETDRALIASSRRVVVVADHTKWGVVGLSTIIGLDQVEVLVTDEGLSQQARAQLGAAVGRLVVAPLAAAHGETG